MDLNAIKTQGSAPASATSSPGLYSPVESQSSKYPAWDAGTPAGSPYLHPLQMHKVKEYVRSFLLPQLSYDVGAVTAYDRS